MLRTILKKLDGIKKGWKRITTSAIYIGAVTVFATKGIDLNLYVDQVEVVYKTLAGTYTTIMAVLFAADAAGKS